MEYVMIAIVAGSLVSSLHPNKEACEGRAAMVREAAKVAAECVKAPGQLNVTGSMLTCCNSGTNAVCIPTAC
jgi:hypothetical protein